MLLFAKDTKESSPIQHNDTEIDRNKESHTGKIRADSYRYMHGFGQLLQEARVLRDNP